MVNLGCETLGRIAAAAVNCAIAGAGSDCQCPAGSQPASVLPQKRRPSLHDAAQHASRNGSLVYRAAVFHAAAVPVEACTGSRAGGYSDFAVSADISTSTACGIDRLAFYSFLLSTCTIAVHAWTSGCNSLIPLIS
jgi:hypothetical protein